MRDVMLYDILVTVLINPIKLKHQLFTKSRNFRLHITTICLMIKDKNEHV